MALANNLAELELIQVWRRFRYLQRELGKPEEARYWLINARTRASFDFVMSGRP